MKHLLASLALLTGLAMTVPAGAAETLKVAGGPTVDVAQFTLANVAGMWKANDLDLSIVPFASGREAFEALIGGQVDLALMAEFPAVIGAMRGQPFSVVAVISRYKGNHIVVKGDKPVTMADLTGKPVGVTIGTNTHFMLDEAASEAGIKVTTVNVGPADIIPALVRGDVAAGAPFPSFYPSAIKALGAEYQEIPVSYATTFVIAASKALVSDRPEALKAFLKTLTEAESQIAADPAPAQEAVAKVNGGNMPLPVVKSVWNNYEYKLTLDPALLDLLNKEGAWIKARGMIKNVDPTPALFSAVIDAAPLKAVDPAAVTLP